MNKRLIPFLCLLPFLGVAFWYLSGKNFGNLLIFGLALVCPLSHIFLMRHNEKGGEPHDKT